MTTDSFAQFCQGFMEVAEKFSEYSDGFFKLALPLALLILLLGIVRHYRTYREFAGLNHVFLLFFVIFLILLFPKMMMGLNSYADYKIENFDYEHFYYAYNGMGMKTLAAYDFASITDLSKISLKGLFLFIVRMLALAGKCIYVVFLFLFFFFRFMISLVYFLKLILFLCFGPVCLSMLTVPETRDVGVNYIKTCFATALCPLVLRAVDVLVLSFFTLLVSFFLSSDFGSETLSQLKGGGNLSETQLFTVVSGCRVTKSSGRDYEIAPLKKRKYVESGDVSQYRNVSGTGIFLLDVIAVFFCLSSIFFYRSFTRMLVDVMTHGSGQGSVGSSLMTLGAAAGVTIGAVSSLVRGVRQGQARGHRNQAMKEDSNVRPNGNGKTGTGSAPSEK